MLVKIHALVAKLDSATVVEKIRNIKTVVGNTCIWCVAATFVHSLVAGFVCVKGRVLVEKYKLNHRTMSNRAEHTETEHHRNNYSILAMRTYEVLM
jgi:hypothetical protein